MNDYGPNSDTLRDASPLVRLTSAMRWPREQAWAAMPDEDDLPRDAPPPDALGEIEARLGRLAERFDQLEFVIVEQFEPGMTEAGELPAGNLRDRLDRIETALGFLRRDAPAAHATWDSAMASDEEVLDAAVLEARLDDIAARLAELAEAAARADRDPETIYARLAMLETRLEAMAKEEAALRSATAASEAQHADLKASLAAELATRNDVLLAALSREAHRAGEAAAEEASSRILEGAAGSLLEQLKSGLAAETEVRETAVLAALDALAAASREAIAAEAAAREAVLFAHAEAAAARESAMAAEAETRHDALLGALERAVNRPPPAPDLTQQHRSFAGFATALQTTLSHFELSVDAILDRLDGMARRLEAVEARIATPAEPCTQEIFPTQASGLETSLGTLSEGLGALVEVLGQKSVPIREPVADAAMLDQFGALVTAAMDEAERGRASAMEESLRDLRLAVAEIAADSLRPRVV